MREKQTAIVEGVGIIMETGGLGKTQTAIEYVHRLGFKYPGGVFWINAELGIFSMIDDIKQTVLLIIGIISVFRGYRLNQ